MTFRIFIHRDGTPLVFNKIEEQTLTIPFFYERGPKKIREAITKHEDFPKGYTLVNWRKL